MSLQLTINIRESQPPVRLPKGALNWNDEDFFEFCQRNRDLRIERTAKGEILVMSPAGSYSSFRSGEVLGQLRAWAQQDKAGVVFDSSGGFRLPNGGVRAADAAWVLKSRLRELSARDKEQFAPLCPDFVVEVASPSDVVADLREKMQEFREAGIRLGWLILPDSMTVESYSPAEVSGFTSPKSLCGDPVLPGFTLDLDPIWNPPF